MNEVREALKLYVQALEARPKGHVRNYSTDSWGYEAWADIVTDDKSKCYRVAFELWDVAANMLGIPRKDYTDLQETQEISEQFYALYADMILEYIRNTRE